MKRIFDSAFVRLAVIATLGFTAAQFQPDCTTASPFPQLCMVQP